VLARVLIAAGGTGGHIIPGLAVAQELQARGYEVQWLGTSDGLERTLVPKAGFFLNEISISGIRGKGVVKLLRAPFTVTTGVMSALREIRRLKPALVVGMGGYVAGPAGIAAKLCGIPLLIHEQNSIAGATNRLLAWLANTTLCAFPGAIKKARVVGNPIRRELETLAETVAERVSAEAIRILIVGGSRGARFLNTSLPPVLRTMSASHRISIWHQCGAGREDEARQAYGASMNDLRVETFIDSMDEAYRWADIVVCRAGALTVSELAAVGKAAILVPFPFAIDDHQTHNANLLVRVGAAKLMQERDFNEQSFVDLMTPMLVDDALRLRMAAAARSAAVAHSTALIADACEELLA